MTLPFPFHMMQYTMPYFCMYDLAIHGMYLIEPWNTESGRATLEVWRSTVPILRKLDLV